MLRYFVTRVIGLLIVLWAMTVVMFALTRAIPGDPVAGLVGYGTPTYVIEAMREQMGLNRPLHEQYFKYLTDLLRGDMGISFESRNPVADDLRRSVAASAELVLVAMILSIPLGIILGVVAAAKWGRAPDSIIRFVSLIGSSAPLFWVALVFQLVFYRQLDLLPVDGRITLTVSAPRTVTGFFLIDSVIAGNWEAFWSSLRHILLPAVALALNTLGLLVRQTRASLLQVLTDDYVRTARAKGLAERVVLFHHALKNAALPIVTEVGLQFGIVLGSTFLVEIVFSWPGLGLYAVRAIVNLDYPAVMGVALLFTAIYVIANFLVDLSYPFFDPRVSR